MLVQRLDQLHSTAAQEAALTRMHVIKPVADMIKTFPSTRYYGSKRKLLPWMYKHLRSLDFKSVLDAFGGTASVSLLFKAMGKEVTYHDGLRFNADIGTTLLAPAPALTRDEVDIFLQGVEPVRGVVAEHFDGIFYTDEENCWIDGFASKLAADGLSGNQQALLRFLIYQACLKKRPYNLFHRANLSIRTSSVTRSFGNAVTWARSFYELAMASYDELARLDIPQAGLCTVMPSTNSEQIGAGYDLVYIDPPYISLKERYNRDDYWRRYHFLEGLACYQDWPSVIDPGSPTRQGEAPQWITEWSRSASFCEKLFSMVKKHSSSTVVLSYVADAYPSESQIMALFESSFPQVSVHSTRHSHALSKTAKREMLFIGSNV